jgi:hypothetical protein
LGAFLANSFPEALFGFRDLLMQDKVDCCKSKLMFLMKVRMLLA